MRTPLVFLGFLLSIGLLLPRLLGSQATAPVARPQLQAKAETKLLMEALAQPNFRALGEQLGQSPTELEAWKFARGQALLLAELGNLLLLRPPRNQGEADWLKQAVDLRECATELARRLAAQDYVQSRAALAQVANSCNRCHRTFRIAVQVTPFTP